MRYERITAVLAAMVCLWLVLLKLKSISFAAVPAKAVPITGAFAYAAQNPLIAGGGIIIALIFCSIFWILKGDSEFLREEGGSAPISKEAADMKIGSSKEIGEAADIKEEKGSQTLQKEEKKNIGSLEKIGKAADIKEEKERKVAPKKEKEEKENIGAHRETDSGANIKSPRQTFYKRQEELRKNNIKKEN